MNKARLYKYSRKQNYLSEDIRHASYNKQALIHTLYSEE